MKVYIADEAGFCFGVKRALNLIARLNEKNQNVQIFGQLIHNRTVLKNLEKKGIGYIESLEELDPGKKLVIRTHGIPKDVESELRKQNIDILDATCPFVKKIHRIVEKIDGKKIRVVIVGDGNHPEVIAAKSYAPGADVINSVAEAEKIKKSKTIGVVAQTTLNSDFFKKIVPVLLDNAEKIEIHNTICHATRIRQKAIKKLAPQVDFVIVVGGKRSSNTRKLFEIALEKNPNTFLIEKSSDLYNLDFIDRVSFFKSVGITAGASTPPDEIEKIKGFFNNLENIEKEIKNGRTKRNFQH
ncbi:MAG: 4-hydroxy-3-methylbut-2-enyl diphosphate reductase [Candidatus Aminicenantes bacterium]|nr:4-hydroxy-3-methylbut-2-enyl diphosphate reductase [Candidatus Aminicenantes bacterium]